MLDKECLQKYIETNQQLEALKTDLRTKKELFEEQNKDTVNKINEMSEVLNQQKEIITTQAKEEYKQTSKKKLLGNIGIRIVKKLSYKANDALIWAKKHDMALSLDKKTFEKIAKTQPLPFVDITEDTKVTFPKEIVIEK